MDGCVLSQLKPSEFYILSCEEASALGFGLFHSYECRAPQKHMPIVIHNDYMIIELPLFTSGARQSSNKLLHKSSCVVNEF